MSAIEPAGEKVIQRLQEALEQLREDIARVELWADALGCFARPVPDYDPSESNLNKFALTSGSPLRRRDGIPSRGALEDAEEAENLLSKTARN